METLIIELKATDDGLDFWLDRPRAMFGGDPASTFHCALNDPAVDALVRGDPGDEVVKAAGARLWDALVANPRVRDTLSTVVSDGKATTIGVRFGAGAPERFPWEVLWAPSGFVALNNWPVARFPNVEGPDAVSLVVDPPVRLLVILAARGIPAAREWEGIRAAVDATPSVPLEVAVFTSEPELAARIKDEQHPSVSVVGVTTSEAVLEQHVRAFPPHLVHVFCHGAAGAGASDVGYLQIATPASWPEAGPQAHIYLSDRNFERWFQQQKPWLTTLSCCDGGAPGEGVASLAFAMVWSGFPAVVGMRRPITVPVAERFTGAHYRETFAVLATALASGEPVRWASATAAVRLELCGLHPGPPTAVALAHDEWSLPVLYLAHADFTVKVAATPATEDVDHGIDAPVGGPVGPGAPVAPVEPVEPAIGPVIGPVTYNRSLRADQITYLQSNLSELRRLRSEFASQPDTTPDFLAQLDQQIDHAAMRLFDQGAPA